MGEFVNAADREGVYGRSTGTASGGRWTQILVILLEGFCFIYRARAVPAEHGHDKQSEGRYACGSGRMRGSSRRYSSDGHTGRTGPDGERRGAGTRGRWRKQPNRTTVNGSQSFGGQSLMLVVESLSVEPKLQQSLPLVQLPSAAGSGVGASTSGNKPLLGIRLQKKTAQLDEDLGWLEKGSLSSFRLASTLR